MPPSPHRKIPAKVTAYVDEGIKDLVELLNTFEGVNTSASCEGEEGKRLAYVYLDYKDPATIRTNDNQFGEMAHFANNLAKILARYSHQNRHEESFLANILIKWTGERKIPFIAFEMPHRAIKSVYSALSNYALTESEDNKIHIQPLVRQELSQ
jgi:hypothetical protein